MATLRGVWAGVLAAALANAAWAQDEPVFVRHRGNPEQFVIRGAETFGEAEIREALALDIDVAVATRADAALDSLRQVLAEKTLAGYLLEGFVEAKVEVNFDPAADQLAINIHEGPRYAAGNVVIEGLDAALAERLRETLTVEKAAAGDVSPPSKQPDTEAKQANAAAKAKKKAPWPVGEPAGLDRETQNRLREKVETTLYDGGRLFPEFTLEPVPDRVQHTVELKIRFSNPGSPARIDELSVIGNEKFSRDEIVKFLDLKEGAIWTEDLQKDLQRRLKQSGRFIRAKAGVKKPSQPGEKLWAWIDVKEYAKAPPLAQPLSPEEQALLKLSQWLADFPQGDLDATITAEAGEYEIEAVASPKFGILVLVRQHSPAGGDAQQPPAIKWALVTSDEQIGFYSLPRGRKLAAIPTPSPVTVEARLSLHDGPPKFTGQGTFQIGLAMSTAAKRGRRRHCDFGFTDTPVSLLSLAHEYDSKLSWAGDVLTVRFQERSLKFDGKTGRLIEFDVQKKEDAMRITVAAGQFEGKLAELDAATRDWPNDAPANVERPLSSVLEFLTEEALGLESPEEAKAYQAEFRLLRKLASLGLLKPLDRLAFAACQPEEEKESFSIPCEYFQFSLAGIDFDGDWLHAPQFQATLQGICSHWGIWLEQLLWPSAAWPRAVFRESIYAQAKKSTAAERAVDLTKLCASPAAGPLCCLATAAAAKELPLGSPISLVANLGKSKLSQAEFQQDVRILLDDKSLLGECLLCLAGALRGLEAEEVETLAAMLKSTECLDQDACDALTAVAAALRPHRDRPIAEATAAAADQLWRLGLRQRLGTLFAEWAAEAEPAVAGGDYAEARETDGYQAAGAESGGNAADFVEGVYQAAPPQIGGTYGGYSGPAAEPAVAVPPADAFIPDMSAAPPLALDGYSPVTLVEKRVWQRGDIRYGVMHLGRFYFFADAREQQTFRKDPDRYAPCLFGNDVVQWAEHKRSTPGKREFGVFYQDRILLFASEDWNCANGESCRRKKRQCGKQCGFACRRARTKRLRIRDRFAAVAA